MKIRLGVGSCKHEKGVWCDVKSMDGDRLEVAGAGIVQVQVRIMCQVSGLHVYTNGVESH